MYKKQFWTTFRKRKRKKKWWKKSQATAEATHLFTTSDFVWPCTSVLFSGLALMFCCFFPCLLTGCDYEESTSTSFEAFREVRGAHNGSGLLIVSLHVTHISWILSVIASKLHNTMSRCSGVHCLQTFKCAPRYALFPSILQIFNS